MAYELKAIFDVQDRMTAKVRRITQEINKLDDAMKRVARTAANLNSSLSRSSNALTGAANNVRNVNNSYRTYNNAVNNTSNTINRNTNIVNRNSTAIHNNTTQINYYNNASNNMNNAIRRQSSALGGLRNSLVGLVGAFASVSVAKKIFDETIGAAAKLETSTVAIDAIFNDKSASDSYMKLVKNMSIDSPVLSQTDMLSSSKGLIAMTKNVDDLGKAWKIAEKLMVLDPTQGTEGAAFALKEMLQGDSLSMVERFGLDKGELNRIKKLDITSQISEIGKLLDGMGITDEAIKKMGQTSEAGWNGVQERFKSFMQVVGGEGNTTMGDFYRRLSTVFDSGNSSEFADKLGGILNNILTKSIEVVEWLWKWREPIAYIVGAVTAAVGAFVMIGAIALLANPISLIAAGVAALSVGFKALYDNSTVFRGAIDGIVAKAKELYAAFQNGGAGGLLDSLFGEGTAEKVGRIIAVIISKFTELQAGFEIVKNALALGCATLSSIFTSAWAIISPILSGLGSMLSAVGEYAMIVFNNIIAPALTFVAQLFTTLWAIAQPILTILGALFQLFGAIVKTQWETILKPLAVFITTGLSNAFGTLTDALSVVAGWFDKVGGWANTAKGYISKFADVIAGIKLPDWVTNGISTVVSTVGKAIGAGSAKSHYHGLSNVPYDGYNARLHKNERVLTAEENKEYNAAKEGGGFGGGFGGGISITGNQFIVRQESDIESIAYQLAKLIEKERA